MSRHHHRSSSSRRAFTLLELMLVMGILVAVAAIAWPTITRSYESVRLRKAADQVQAGRHLDRGRRAPPDLGAPTGRVPPRRCPACRQGDHGLGAPRRPKPDRAHPGRAGCPLHGAGPGAGPSDGGIRRGGASQPPSAGVSGRQRPTRRGGPKPPASSPVPRPPINREAGREIDPTGIRQPHSGGLPCPSTASISSSVIFCRQSKSPTKPPREWVTMLTRAPVGSLLAKSNAFLIGLSGRVKPVTPD